jgi:hypothetical protein
MPSTVWSGSKSFTVPAGTATVVDIPMPHRGILKGYSLIAADVGSAGNFTATLYTSKRAEAPNNTLPEASFKLLSFDQSTPADEDLNLSYLNRDGKPSTPVRYLYLKITPAGSGNKNYVFSVTVDTPTLR